MSIERRNFPQFFITAPAPCPYLPGRVERKVFTHLVGQEARALNTQLSQGGFRRSQNIAYRPACDGCTACVSVRVKADLFDFGGAPGRILRRNADLVGEITRARASSEHYSLFRDYIENRHGDGGMADMSVLDFSAMVDESFVDSRLIDFRFRSSHPEAGQLVASVLIDILGDGLSMIYSFYRPDLPKRSLGTFMILDCIRKAQRLGLPYVYLGYWVQGSQKMNYKARFMPQERLTPDGWVLHTR